jgi:predicted house-cleaning noncanonical NTP pyrophosphatase (MazG superfamily)
MTHAMTHAMTHTQTYIELNVKQIIEAFGFSRKTFERWRDEVWGGENGVGDPPYSLDELKIILENAEKKAASAFGASKNKNTRKISRILRSL